MNFFPKKLASAAALTALVSLTIFGTPAVQANTSNKLVSVAVNSNGDLSAEAKQFYAKRNFHPIWVGRKNKARAKALIEAVSSAAEHGLPKSQYQLAKLRSALNSRRSNLDATAEMFATQIFLKYAHDLSSGILNPKRVSKEIEV